MGDIPKNIPEIIKEASQSPLGMIALIIIVLAGFALYSFRNDAVRVRLAIFGVLVTGLVAFAAVLWAADQKRQKESLRTAMNLVVLKDANGEGTITSEPPGIDCGHVCAKSYSQGTAVTLIPTPDDSSNFAGWGGAASCKDGTVTLNEPITCKATFAARFCFIVDAKKPWQSAPPFLSEFRRIIHISGQWSIDPENYAYVGPMGYTMVDTQKISQKAT